MREHAVERARHPAEIERLDEQTRVPDLPAAAAAHEAPELLLDRPSLPLGLLLERAKRAKVSLRVDNLFHGGGAEGADQLVLEVGVAHVEAEPFHIGAREFGAEARPLETAPELALLCSVTETREPDVEPLRTEQRQKASYRLRTSDRNNGDALGVEIPTLPPSERFERAPVANPFDEHDRTAIDACGERVCRGSRWSTRTASHRFDRRRVKSLLFVHIGIFTARVASGARYRSRS